MLDDEGPTGVQGGRGRRLEVGARGGEEAGPGRSVRVKCSEPNLIAARQGRLPFRAQISHPSCHLVTEGTSQIMVRIPEAKRAPAHVAISAFLAHGRDNMANLPYLWQCQRQIGEKRRIKGGRYKHHGLTQPR